MKFEEAIKQLNEETINKLASCKDVNEAIKIFAENGISISSKDVEEAMNKQNGELSDDELATVTGGTMFALPDLFQLIMRKVLGQVKDEVKKNIL